MSMADEGLTIEVGPRTAPFVEELRKDLLTGDKIVYFEKRRGWVKELAGKLDGKETVIQGHGSRIPLPDNSVGVVFAKDLFGSHGMLAVLPGPRFAEKEDIGKGFGEAWFRVCRPGGKVIIVEVSTPANFEDLNKEFLDAGFVKVEEHKEKDTVNVYEKGPKLKTYAESLPRGSYSVVYQKPVESSLKS